MTSENLARSQRPGEVCVNEVVPIPLREIQRWGALVEARGVDQDIHFTELLEGSLQHCFERCSIGHVGAYTQRSAPQRLDLVRHSIYQFHAPCAGHDVGSGLGYSAREGAA